MEQDKAPEDTEKKVKTYDISMPPDSDVDHLEEELRELRDSVSRHDENIQSYVEQIRRLQADFENWRRRVEQEKAFLVENASSVLTGKLLPVLDSFERALALQGEQPAADSGEKGVGDRSLSRPAADSILEGITLIYRQISDLLKEEGLTPIKTVGAQFDPKLHEAVAYEERESGEDHTILEEARKGYVFKGRVLRPALVKVLRLTH